MDVRAAKKVPKQEDLLIEQDDKLTDSLIYNIIKKIEFKEAMESKYEENRLPQVKQLPYGLGHKIHSANGLGYFLAVTSGLLYMRYKAKKKLKLVAFLPHAVIALSINEYDRYKGIISFNKELTNQYKSYQDNTKRIIEQMRRRVSLIQIIKSSQIVTLSKIAQMVNYKPIY